MRLRNNIPIMKELIYFKTCSLKPEGGPAGYLYDLNQELKKESISWIDFVEASDGAAKRMVYKLPTPLKNKLVGLKRYLTRNDVLKALNDGPKKGFASLDGYDIVHFHSTLEMYLAKDLLSDYRGKVLLTSHCPKVAFKEVIEDYTSKKDYLKHKKEYDKLEIIDEYAFNRADKIIFPCEYAEEPYYHTWNKYEKIHKDNKDKYVYIPTGIVPISTDGFSREGVRRKYNIPDNKFVVCYIGRHNNVKGYDQLKEIAKEIFEHGKDICFLVAGKEEPLKGINDPNWIEAGWIENPNELIFASDVFILPNKETYFDLILLQVMSIGKPVVLTNTGGNKYFKQFNSRGMFFYDYGNIKEAVKNILELSETNPESLLDGGSQNRKIFEREFTIAKFTKKYVEEIRKIYQG